MSCMGVPVQAGVCNQLDMFIRILTGIACIFIILTV